MLLGNTLTLPLPPHLNKSTCIYIFQSYLVVPFQNGDGVQHHIAFIQHLLGGPGYDRRPLDRASVRKFGAKLTVGPSEGRRHPCARPVRAAESRDVLFRLMFGARGGEGWVGRWGGRMGRWGGRTHVLDVLIVRLERALFLPQRFPMVNC